MLRKLFAKSSRKIFNAFSLTALLLSTAFVSSLPTAEAVTIKGKRLAEISDIVREVTSSDFPEIPKHSLLFLERAKPTDGENYSIVYKMRIFLINNDGSLKAENDTIYFDGSDAPPISPRLDVIQKQNLTISPKPFGMRRNIVYSDAGLTDDYNSRYAFTRQESDGTEENAKLESYGWGNYLTDSNRNIWGNACLQVQGMEDKDVCVVVHSSKMDTSGNLYFKFLTVARDESAEGSNGMNVIPVNGQNEDSLGWKVWDYNNGIRGIDVSAAGDIDGDGYKNEFAMAWNSNGSVILYIYQVTSDGDSLSVKCIHEELIHDGYSGSDYGFEQGCPNAVVGDFDGDGVDEAAFVGRVFPWNGENEHNSMRVGILDYNGGSWRYESDSFPCQPGYHGENSETPCRATRCDFDGDGKDELAILFLEEPTPGTLYPRLERWYCDNGSITPHRDYDHRKGGADNEDTSVLGYTCANTNDYYKNIEELQITAGPLTGTRGKAKLAEDVAISHVYEDASRVFVIPTILDESTKDFAGFGTSQKVYENTDSDSIRRGTVITADFLNESLMLDKPTHLQDEHDESYVALLEALPYHVDNVSTDGTLTSYPINYTFSGFGDLSDGIKGDMSVSYITRKSSSEQKDVSFGLASTTETISVLGKAGPYVQGYLKFRATEANIAGNFDPRIKAAAGAMNAIMDFVTDKIDRTTTNSQSYANSATVSTTMEVKQFDGFVTYTAPQHIWRYKILNNPLPSWYILGPKADYASGDYSEVESRTHHITFSMYDEAMPMVAYSNQHYAYQPRHEEGNFFSYPSTLEDIEGYSSDGALVSTPYRAEWTKSEVGMAISFDQSQIDSQKYDESVKKSQLTKGISAIASFFGAKDPSPLPPYTSHSESFVKKYSSQEGINIKVYGRTTLPGEAAGHRIIAMPFTAREGTMTVGTAVELIDVGEPYGPALWYTTSRYSKLPDPALVLPRKWAMAGATLIANDQRIASIGRGIRYYIPALKQDSTNTILGGLQYEISIPVYNASFVETGDFDVSLSYVISESFDISAPLSKMGNLTHIQTVTMSLQGWQNGSRLNKGWAKFTWDVPAELDDGKYYLYVQIDPAHKLNEVHESRIGADGKVDIGGNNEAYYVFNYTAPKTIVEKRDRQVSGSFKAAAHTDNGTILRTAYRSGNEDNGVSSAMSIYDTTGMVNVKAKVEGYDDAMDVLYLLSFLEDIFGTGSRDSFPVECELEYTGEEYYPEAYFYGVNYKAGTLDAVGGDYSKISDDAVNNYFMVDKLPLVPGKTVKFMLELHPGQIDWINGSGFELVVPELAAETITNSDDVKLSDPATEPTTEPTTPTDPEEPEDSGEVGVSSTSGGCETGTGIFAAVILAGAAVLRRKSR